MALPSHQDVAMRLEEVERRIEFIMKSIRGKYASGVCDAGGNMVIKDGTMLDIYKMSRVLGVDVETARVKAEGE